MSKLATYISGSQQFFRHSQQCKSYLEMRISLSILLFILPCESVFKLCMHGNGADYGCQLFVNEVLLWSKNFFETAKFLVLYFSYKKNVEKNYTSVLQIFSSFVQYVEQGSFKLMSEKCSMRWHFLMIHIIKNIPYFNVMCKKKKPHTNY